MLKQSVNGLFKALCASLIVTSLPLNKWVFHSLEKTTNPMNKIFFNLLVAFVLFPALTLLVINSRYELQKIETDIMSYLKNISGDMVDHFNSWHQQRLHVLTELAQAAESSNMKPTMELQQRIILMQKVFPEFQKITIADAKGKSIASYPQIKKKGEAMASMVFSKMPYLETLKSTMKPVLSDVYIGQDSKIPHVS